MFWSSKVYNTGLRFGASGVTILVCVLELQGYNIGLCFRASRLIILVCVLGLQGL